MRSGIGAPKFVLVPSYSYESQDGLEQLFIHPTQTATRRISPATPLTPSPCWRPSSGSRRSTTSASPRT
eukprot:8412695-Alexandrium_andersonii.AAC.1